MSDLELTKKAEAYVAAQSAQPEQFAEPGLLTLQIDRTSRKSLAGSIEALIDMLDDLSPDCDLEDGDDAEPWLGWTGNGPRVISSFIMDARGSACEDREVDESELEDSLGWQNENSQARLSWGQDDKEPELGWTEHVDQTLAGKVEEGRWLTDDGEPELGFVGIGTGWRKGEDIADVCEHVDGREPDGRGPAAKPEKKLRENARRLPSGDIVREIEAKVQIPTLPLDPDAMDLRAHYWAAKGFG
ncbi:hypothetical protein [Mesorhizobium argentiipisi]|uniref:Uncharacterized protein n=1 Tax=Mesorhizobium argentiipisi TaxID=3015175 RepID=A0ABU8KDE4_9HYPH